MALASPPQWGGEEEAADCLLLFLLSFYFCFFLNTVTSSLIPKALLLFRIQSFLCYPDSSHLQSQMEEAPSQPFSTLAFFSGISTIGVYAHAFPLARSVYYFPYLP
jgi:hypothetical protein